MPKPFCEILTIGPAVYNGVAVFFCRRGAVVFRAEGLQANGRVPFFLNRSGPQQAQFHEHSCANADEGFALYFS